MERDKNPLSNAVIPVLEYLTALHLEGKSYSTINIHRSMLSTTLGLVNGGTPIGQDPLVIRLLKGIYNTNPPEPRYLTMWDPEIVLNHMRKVDNESLNISSLSQKLVTLLALTSLLRTAELASIKKESLLITERSASFSLSKPRKSQFNGPLKTFNLEAYPADKRICPVSCLGYYVFLTDVLRTDQNSSLLFIGLVAPHLPVSGNTVVRWIKSFLGEAGIDISIFSAHSTRGAAASKAAETGDSTNSILRAGGWSSESTFARFYRRTIVSPDDTATSSQSGQRV